MVDSQESNFKPLYSDEMNLWDKTKYIAQNIYGADDIIADKKVRDQFAQFDKNGYSNYPICMAKTQYSFSTDPSLMGAPSGHEVPIREIRLCSGAEFIVVVCGAIMTMPGLPRKPASENIGVDKDKNIEGLF
jgi:formate--tetrahydrofolate ligase